MDLSVFTYLQRYYLTAEANIEQLPIGLTNLSTLNSVTFDADTFALPEIDGAAFPENLSFLSIATSQHAIKLKSWQTHQLATLTLNGAEVDFNNTAFPNLVKLDLAKTPLLKNYDFTDFAKVTNLSWQYQYEQNPTIYHTTRAQFPLLLNEAVQWGFPLMEDINGKTSGTHAFNNSSFLNVLFINTAINPGPHISTGYELVIEYTQGKNAGEIVTISFNCETVLSVTICTHPNDFSSSYDNDTYNSSIFSYRIKGSLEGAKITAYSTTPYHKDLLSSPTYWDSTGKHEQFLDEIKYEDALLPTLEAGSIYYYHLLVLLLVVLVRVRKANSAVTT